MGVSGHVAGSESIREGFYGLGTRGHVSLSKSFRRVAGESPGWALGVGFGMRGALARHPGGVILASALGTGSSLATFPGILSQSITRDTWHSPKVSPKEAPKGAFVGASGHVACSEGLRRGLSGWHAPKEVLEGCFEGSFGWLSGHVAHSEGKFEEGL